MDDELREKIVKRIAYGECQVCNACGADIDVDDPGAVADDVFALIKEAGYFQEEAEWIGKLLKEGWIPPAEANTLTMKVLEVY